MDEWQALIMDTYNKVKKESNVKQNYGGIPGNGSTTGNTGGSSNNLLSGSNSNNN